MTEFVTEKELVYSEVLLSVTINPPHDHTRYDRPPTIWIHLPWCQREKIQQLPHEGLHRKMQTGPKVSLIKCNVTLVLRATSSLVRVRDPQDDVIRDLITTPYPIDVVLVYFTEIRQDFPGPIHPRQLTRTRRARGRFR
jgi:hypothetical protein